MVCFSRRLILVRVVVACSMATAALEGRAATVEYNMVDMLNTGSMANYRIGVREVTIGQYCDFLNAVANQTDEYGLFSGSMGSGTNGGVILRLGSEGSWTYHAQEPQGVQSPYATASNRPITFVSWFDAARFANWMSNGQGKASTETGAYELNGITSGIAPARNSAAAFFLPTVSEWAQAAYYSSTLNLGFGGYFAYATGSDLPPANVPGAALNSANLRVNGLSAITQSSALVPNQNYLTDAGAYSSSISPNGTFDQTGNVSEWTSADGSSNQTAMGGNWRDAPGNATSSKSLTLPTTLELDNVGFRLAGAYPPPPPPLPPTLPPIVIDVPTGQTKLQSQSRYAKGGLDGTRPVEKTGGGTFIVDEANPLLTGSFTIQSGTVLLSHADAVVNSLQVPADGGTLAIASGLHVRVAGVALEAGGFVDVGRGRITIPALSLPPIDYLRESHGHESWLVRRRIGSTAADNEASQGIPRTVGWLANLDGSVDFSYAAPGDTNIDGVIDCLDAANFMAPGKFDTGEAAAWVDGDFNYDRIVDLLDASDFIAAGLYDYDAGNCNATPGIAAVPEPNAVVIVGSGAVVAACVAVRRTMRC